MQGKVASGHMQRLNQARARTRHIHRVQRPSAQPPRNLSRCRRLERVAGDPAVDEEVDIGRR